MGELDTGDMRARILEKATDLFVRQGYNGISMREIAEACGLSKAGLYYHFKDKEDLFLAILGENLSQLGGLINDAQGRGQTAAEQLQLFIRAIFTQLPAGRRSIIRLASQEMDKVSIEARTDFHQRYNQEFVGRIRAILDAGMRAGEFRRLDPGLCAWALLGLMYPFMSQDNPVDAVELISTLFLEGVRAGE